MDRYYKHKIIDEYYIVSSDGSFLWCYPETDSKWRSGLAKFAIIDYVELTKEELFLELL